MERNDDRVQESNAGELQGEQARAREREYILTLDMMYINPHPFCCHQVCVP